MANLQREKRSRDERDYFARIPTFRHTTPSGAVGDPKIRAAKLELANGSSIRVSHDFSNIRSSSLASELEKY